MTHTKVDGCTVNTYLMDDGGWERGMEPGKFCGMRHGKADDEPYKALLSSDSDLFPLS